jgi:thiamine pyrophosphate-dependent acetolactate synthase large subunit-like protein
MIILAGDGNALMSLGTLATIGKSSPRNLMYIVLDNECHESTGGQETSSSIAKLATIASSCCFANSQHTHSPNELRRIVVKFLRMEGPSFIHVKVNKERVEVPRIMMAPTEIKDRFINRLCSTSSIV